MAKAVVDPAELRRFAQELKKFTVDLQQQTGILNGRMATLAQTWRDQEQAKFAEEFDATVRVLQKFTKAAEQHVPYLLRKADAADAYLNQR
jgi:uncharacterized protein YukE